MLIIHNMYFPHGYQYTYIYFREGVKAVAEGGGSGLKNISQKFVNWHLSEPK